MALLKIKDFDPNYKDIFGGEDIKGYGVYSERSEEKIGSVDDILVDEDGNFRYFVVDLGFWIFGKKVLIPIGSARVDYDADRVYALGLTKEQAENLPEYHHERNVDYDHEEQVRGVYRPMMTDTGTVAGGAAAGTAAQAYDYDRDTYAYDRDPSLYRMNEQSHSTLRLYEERLIANKRRQKTGEVTVGKHVETETVRASVPVERERVVIERTTPEGRTAVNPGEADFQEGEVARMEIYEETPDIHKEAFVREEVQVRKEVDRETVDAQETIRREELDIDKQGRAVDERREGRGINNRQDRDLL
jgi:uncharacterized protein (TIGR02271 family)